MTTAEPVGLTDGERGVANVVPCHHYYAWVSPAGARDSARICMTCHAPDPDWLNTLAAERAAHEAQVQAGDGLREAVEDALYELSEMRPHIPPSTAPNRRDCIVMRDTLNRAIRKVRAALAATAPTPPQDETGATS